MSTERLAADAPFLSVVVPAYNEARRIGGSLQAAADFLRAAPWTWELLVVDDGSTDATAEHVRAASAAEPRIRLLTIPHGGKGRAVQAGMLAARGSMRYLADADFSTPIDEIQRFLVAMQDGADLAIGSREHARAERIGEPLRRHLMGRVFNRIVQWLALPGIQDTQCGFKCLRGAVADDLFGRLSIPGFAFDVELLAHARHLGYRVSEVPVTWTYVPGGKVRMIRDTLRMFRDVLAVRRHMHATYGRSVPAPRAPLQMPSAHHGERRVTGEQNRDAAVGR